MLAVAYSRPMSAVRAAAELGTAVSNLAKQANRDDSPASVLARRLMQGLVPREEVESASADLIAAPGIRPARPGEPKERANPGQAFPSHEAAASDEAPSVDAGPGIILYSDKARYSPGEALQLTVRVTADCHLTLVSVDQRGRGTVIYPSDFETNSLITAGQVLRLPARGAPYAFRLREKGTEQIVALCNEASSLIDAITHDFERQRFTDLGNYPDYVLKHATGLGADAPATGRPDRRSRGRRRKPEPTGQPARPDQINRTAITIVIE
jgi:hypothetical protein